MIESLFTVSIAGLVAGFIFSMPIAGPISVIVASNALKGKLRYCNLVSLGASIADFVYMFIAVFGLTRLYSLYEPAIPYIYSVGSIIFFYIGYRIIRTKIDIEHLEVKNPLPDNIKKKVKGGFYTGFMVNTFNPTLFIGALTSSFFVISLIASLGLHTGGLAVKMDQKVNEIGKMDGVKIENSKNLALKKIENLKILKSNERKQDQTIYTSKFHLVISIFYAFFLSLGNVIWLFLMAFLIVRFRFHINIKVISLMIKSLGVVLWILGLYFIFLAVRIFFSL
jgi:threonine/homoserine/homoserine lactone efflux protein